MKRLLVIVLILLALTGCVTLSAKDDSPESDLLAFKALMHRVLAPRTLPNGKLYCAEGAATDGQQDRCLGQQEDLSFNSEQDKAEGRRQTDKFVARQTLARRPCNALQRLFRVDRCRIPED